MRMVYHNLDLVFELNEDKINSIVIENKKEYEKIIYSISNSILKVEESIEIKEENKSLNLNKVAELIISPFDLTYSERKIQKFLFANLVEDAEFSEINNEISNLYSQIMQKLDDLEMKTEFNLEHKIDIGILDVLKDMKVALKQPEGDFTERFIEYAENMNRLLGIRIFFIANCDAYILRNEYEELVKWALYHDICVIFIRNVQINLNFEQNEYIIDEDLCELY